MKLVVAIASLVLLSACQVEEISSTPVIEYGSIEGVVKLSDGGVASGIEVRLLSVTSRCWVCGPLSAQYHDEGTTTANEEGHFEFRKVRTGRYAVSPGAYEGYHHEDVGDPPSFIVFADRTASVTYVLTPTP
jgi:hypothetical protein